MSNVVNLDRHRPGDGTRSVAETLRKIAEGIDAGELNPSLVYVAMLERVPDSTDVDQMWSMSTMTRMERIGLLARHLHLANET